MFSFFTIKRDILQHVFWSQAESSSNSPTEGKNWQITTAMSADSSPNFPGCYNTKNNISISPMLYPEGSGGERQILLCINSHLQYIWQRNFIVLTWLGFYHPQCRNTTVKLVNQLPSCSNDSLTTRRTIMFKYRIISVYMLNYPWCYGDSGSLHNILGTIDMCSLHWVKWYSHPLKD